LVIFQERNELKLLVTTPAGVGISTIPALSRAVLTQQQRHRARILDKP
jgi:hypothetical protein